MGKKQPKPSLLKLDTSKALETLRILASHPAIAGLAIMTGSTVVRMAVLSGARSEQLIHEPWPGTGYGSKDPKTDAILATLSGIYNGAQTITLAGMVVPIVQAVGGAVAGGLSAVYAPIPKPPSGQATLQSTD